MKWRSYPKLSKKYYYEIKQDPAVGFYFFVFDGNKCVHDNLQDTLKIAIDYAFEEYGVPEDSWELIRE